MNSTIICYCTTTDKGTIVQAISNGNISLEMIKESTNACTGNQCKELNPSGKCCSSDIHELIRIYGEVDNTDKKCCSCCS
ncbi:MAG: (2Fe-2S)-binding protein [Candidatus Sabulitectum sp.]|nr:(2Fe-2S)-binding protein [Candidatus Sabulitectum sp.]